MPFSQPQLLHFVLNALIAIGAVFLLLAIFTELALKAPRWVRVAMALGAVGLLACGLAGIYLLLWGLSLSNGTQTAILLCQDAMGAFGMGICATLLLSGHLAKKPK